MARQIGYIKGGEFKAIWEIARQPRETHPSTLTTRHNLARQIG